jgi:hypothetical protein
VGKSIIRYYEIPVKKEDYEFSSSRKCAMIVDYEIYFDMEEDY